MSVLTLPADLNAQVRSALAEDIGTGDVTALLIPEERQGHAQVLCREAAVLCGTAWFDETFRQLDPAVHVQWHAKDGESIAAGTVICDLIGPARALLTGERTALNFVQLLSATASTTREYVRAVDGLPCRILDTRKTIPGLRTAQKYAVRCGGGSNHRMGLSDLVLIKENHIAAAGSISAAVEQARQRSPDTRVEVETETLAQVSEALSARADIIMLDNFSLDLMRRAVVLNRAASPSAVLEASGGAQLEAVRDIAATGVDLISVGAITKHVRAVDLSMRFVTTAL